jgi:hypothetical protein
MWYCWISPDHSPPQPAARQCPLNRYNLFQLKDVWSSSSQSFEGFRKLLLIVGDHGQAGSYRFVPSD